MNMNPPETKRPVAVQWLTPGELKQLMANAPDQEMLLTIELAFRHCVWPTELDSILAEDVVFNSDGHPIAFGIVAPQRSKTSRWVMINPESSALLRALLLTGGCNALLQESVFASPGDVPATPSFSTPSPPVGASPLLLPRLASRWRGSTVTIAFQFHTTMPESTGAFAQTSSASPACLAIGDGSRQLSGLILLKKPLSFFACFFRLRRVQAN
jgi:hypothetical protein